MFSRSEVISHVAYEHRVRDHDRLIGNLTEPPLNAGRPLPSQRGGASRTPAIVGPALIIVVSLGLQWTL